MSKMLVNLQNLDGYNALLIGKSPIEMLEWVLSIAKNPIVTTNFRPYEASILYLITRIQPNIKVLFVDSGYNTVQAYRHAQQLIQQLNLNVITYIPSQTRAFRDVVLEEVTINGIPDVDSPYHEEFTEQVKLEPFLRALADLNPDVWFNAIRKD